MQNCRNLQAKAYSVGGMGNRGDALPLKKFSWQFPSPRIRKQEGRPVKRGGKREKEGIIVLYLLIFGTFITWVRGQIKFFGWILYPPDLFCPLVNHAPPPEYAPAYNCFQSRRTLLKKQKQRYLKNFISVLRWKNN